MPCPGACPWLVRVDQEGGRCGSRCGMRGWEMKDRFVEHEPSGSGPKQHAGPLLPSPPVSQLLPSPP